MIKVNGQTIDYTTFPDGTVQVWKLKDIPPGPAHVLWKYQNLTEFFVLNQIFDLFMVTELTIHYLPFARQDKKVSNNQCFGLTSFNRLLNAVPTLNFKPKLRIYAAHSGDTEELHSQLSNWNVENITYAPWDDSGVGYDAEVWIGADSSVHKHFELDPLDDLIPYDHFCKLRDPKTGVIYKTLNPELKGISLKGKKVLVLDDIVDGGATLEIVAKELRKYEPAELRLRVLYAVGRTGLNKCKELFDEVEVDYLLEV